METNAYPLLSGINSIEDFLRLPDDSLDALAGELRARMIEVVGRNGGHLASSLGAVEIIIAMHRAFSSPQDKLVFDVGHQAYAHKLLTGRNARFDTLRTEGGISGFPKRAESPHDAFDTGHASTSISAALGMARAMQLRGEGGTAVALIGDGALTGGMAFEALNDAGASEVPLVVILNDNGMSISANVGSLRRSLTNMRISQGYLRFKRAIARMLDVGPLGRALSHRMEDFKNRVKNFLLPHLLFEDMGFTYLGPIDGHDIGELVHVLRRARALRRPVVVHAITKKGCGYSPAERDPERFHGISPARAAQSSRRSNSEVFGEALLRAARPARDYVDVPTLPAVSMDVAFVVDEGVAHEKLVQCMASAGGKLLEDARLFDVYRDEERVGAGKKSMAYALTYRAADRTLTSDEVDKAHERLVKKVCAATGAEVRG